VPVIALALLAADLQARTLVWEGRAWEVKSGYGGPGPNRWSDTLDSAWVDDDGALHLAIRQIDSGWTSAEVSSLECATYGAHRFYVDAALDQLDANVVIAPFLYADDLTEIDIEFSRWGDPDNPDSAQYVVQPPRAATIHTFPLALTGTYTTHTIDWRAGEVRFSSLHGHYEAAPDRSYLIAAHRVAGAAVPWEGEGLRVHLNAWLVGGEPPTDGGEVEVIFRGADLPPFQSCPE
jgi:hypothetical protein